MFYVDFLEGYYECVWLKARPTIAILLCEEGHNSGARFVCPETCGVCSDDCVDDAFAKFPVKGILRDCEWLDLRPQYLKDVCVFGNKAWSVCRETCENVRNRPGVLVLVK